MTGQLYRAQPVPEFRDRRRNIPRTDVSIAAAAMEKLQRLLKGAKENRVFSPLCVYHCAAILAEVTSGECKRQITDFTGADDNSRRTFIREALTANNAVCSWGDNKCSSMTGASVWLNGELEFEKLILKSLCDRMRADIFSCDMSDEKTSKIAGNWLSVHTGGFLDSIQDIYMDSSTVLEIISSVYISSPWWSPFDEKNSKPGIFHSYGKDIKCRYMHSVKDGTLYTGENFTACARDTYNGSVWFILPHKNASADDVIKSGQLIKLLCDPHNFPSKPAEIDLKVPGFDISCKLDLRGVFNAMGMTDMFDGSRCDMSGFLRSSLSVCVSKINHCARVKIDENGIEAAAYTDTGIVLSAISPEYKKVSFVLDRPFIFAVTGYDRTIIAEGICIQPE